MKHTKETSGSIAICDYIRLFLFFCFFCCLFLLLLFHVLHLFLCLILILKSACKFIKSVFVNKSRSPLGVLGSLNLCLNELYFKEIENPFWTKLNFENELYKGIPLLLEPRHIKHSTDILLNSAISACTIQEIP